MARFLIIDDSLLARYTHKNILHKMGHETVEACNGKEGLELISKEQFDAVLVDMMMPVMDGVAFLEALQEQQIPLPVIVLSADIQESKRVECLALGALGFIEKPATQQKILNLFNEVLSI